MNEIPDTKEQLFSERRAELYYALSGQSRRALLAPFRRKTNYALAAAAVCLIAISGFLLGRGTSNHTDTDAAREIVSAHVRSLMVSHLADVPSSDRHTVKPWFDGKLDFAPRVADLAGVGFPLTGGRLDYVASRPVAALVYARRKHFINVFEWPASRNDASPRLIVSRGYQIYTWTDGGFEYWAISDVNAAELQQFSELLIRADK